MRIHTLAALAIAATLASPASQAVPPGGGANATPGNGYARGGAYRPGWGPGYRYGGWRFGYPGYGYGYGYGYGFGLGYGAGWAVTAASPWYWGAPGFYPYASYPAPTAPALFAAEELVYVQQPRAEAAVPAPARKAPGYWYYCTEPAGYHPYVAQCSRPWIAVQPQAAAPNDAVNPSAAAP